MAAPPFLLPPRSAAELIAYLRRLPKNEVRALRQRLENLEKVVYKQAG